MAANWVAILIAVPVVIVLKAAVIYAVLRGLGSAHELSVRAAFQPAEVLAMAERAGLAGASLQRCWPERYLLHWERA